MALAATLCSCATAANRRELYNNLSANGVWHDYKQDHEGDVPAGPVTVETTTTTTRRGPHQPPSSPLPETAPPPPAPAARAGGSAPATGGSRTGRRPAPAAVPGTEATTPAAPAPVAPAPVAPDASAPAVPAPPQ